MSEVVWTNAIETLVKSLGEKSLSLSWLHSQSEKRYSGLNNYLAIPSIILSTITATIGGTFAGNKEISYVTSTISIVVSVLSTLNSYFVFAKRAEAHRITAISYSKLYLQISIELSLPRAKRMNVKECLKSINEQIQRMNEIQPLIPDFVINMYNKKFDGLYPNIARAECTNGLVEIKVYIDEIIPKEISAIEQPTIPVEISKKPFR